MGINRIIVYSDNRGFAPTRGDDRQLKNPSLSLNVKSG